MSDVGRVIVAGDQLGSHACGAVQIGTVLDDRSVAGRLVLIEPVPAAAESADRTAFPCRDRARRTRSAAEPRHRRGFRPPIRDGGRHCSLSPADQTCHRHAYEAVRARSDQGRYSWPRRATCIEDRARADHRVGPTLRPARSCRAGQVRRPAGSCSAKDWRNASSLVRVACHSSYAARSSKACSPSGRYRADPFSSKRALPIPMASSDPGNGLQERALVDRRCPRLSENE